ncbi:hypothetical protein VHEMI02346 [[Torrubiella] hemipterigena]|uniref:Uncharacterized protein n=1 Tax=[Torrubiella] hemipterigena TaxID=1531966 RepID=A0A0A1T7X6_9HYPO|nr:hypothetical protein VHEMI02346 [[Torrubiella] hemipterigena]
MAATHISSPPLPGANGAVKQPPSTLYANTDSAVRIKTQEDDDDANTNRRSISKPLRLVTSQSTKDKERDTKSASRLDPLSTQIYLRTNNHPEPTIAQRFRSAGRPDSPNPESVGRKSHDLVSSFTLGDAKDKKKGSSFLSRAFRGNFRKDDDADSGSEMDESRTEGSSAKAFTSSLMSDGGGFIPQYKEPARYIRVKTQHKKHRTHNHLFLAQELTTAKAPLSKRDSVATAVGSKLMKGGDAIWAAEFSNDGRYLAVGGKDQIVRVYAVITTPEERRAFEEAEETDSDRTKDEQLSAPVFQTTPIREYTGHTGEVLAISWSKNNFLLTSSMDKTVRLWHLSRKECIGVFNHDDLVTSIAFHPTDDRFFLAGSLDSQLRLWSIPDKSVAFSAPTNVFITAVAFSPDGRTAICGLLTGLCLFYETDGLKNQTQIHVRSSRGKNAKGSKITGIRTIVPCGGDADDVKVLISSNDSRVRIYNLKTKMLEVKFKGLENQSSQIHARFSDDGRFISSGSEDSKAYIWSMDNLDAELKDKQPYEYFEANPEVVTTTLIAPTTTKMLLSASQDPIYDLCNPPPVTLLSLGEAAASQSALSDGGNTEGGQSVRRQAESPAYIQRSKHKEGNIIITTDRTGTIKVFRQDCAYAKRHSNLWETSSKFSSKAAGIGRSGSIVTRNSASSRVNSRRGSMSMANSPATAQADLINNWRHDVEGRRRSNSGTPSRSERSLSPSKVPRSPLNLSASNLASEARKQPYLVNTGAGLPKSGSAPLPSGRPKLPPIQGSVANIHRQDSQPPTPSFSLLSVSSSEGGDDKSPGGFWNIGRWRGMSGLRNVTTVSATSNGSGKGSHSRNPSESHPDKARTRQSMIVPDFKMISATDDDRRKSTGPMLAPKKVVVEDDDEDEEQPQLRVGKRRPVSPSKRRTDSGLGQLSDESDASD